MQRMPRLLSLAICLATLACSAPAAARCVPQVRNAWLRVPPGAPGMVAGFGTIENRCSAPFTVVAARSTAFGGASLHETRVVDGVSQMRPVTELRLAPGGHADLQPGGMHLMLMGPTRPLAAKTPVPVDFKLSNGQWISAEFDVRPMVP